MRGFTWKLGFGLAIAVVAMCSAPVTRADQTASMDLTGVGNNGVFDNIYIGPYQASINGGATTPVICDDFGDESYIPETWTAYVTNETNVAASVLGGSSPLRWVATGGTLAQDAAMTQADYNQASWLANQLIGASGSSATAIQFAIWDLLDPTDVAGYTLPAGAITWLNNSKAYANTEFSDVTIYSVDLSDPISCPDEPRGTCSASNPPQEFMTVTTPEPSTLLMLGLGLGAMFLMWRRHRTVGSSMTVA